jgi:hypothetical protein
VAESFETFCERCGTRQVPEPEPERSALAGRILRGLRRNERSELDLSGPGAGTPREPFLRLCLACRGYNCPACWNNDAGFCQECVPLPGEQPAAVAAESVAQAVTQGPAEEPLATPADPEWPAGDLPPAKAEAEAVEEPVTESEAVEADALAVSVEPEAVAAAAEVEVEAVAVEAEVEVEAVAVEAEVEVEAVAVEAETVAAEAEVEPVVEPVPAAPAEIVISEEQKAFVREMTDGVDVSAILELPAVSDLLADLEWTTDEEPASEHEPIAAEAEAELEPETVEHEPVAAVAELEPVVAEAEVEPWVEWPSTSEAPKPFMVPPPATPPFSQPGASSTPIAGQLPPGASLPHPAAVQTSAEPPLSNLAAELMLQSPPQIRECHQCQLPLSAKAHFCRRCGSRQDAQPH